MDRYPGPVATAAPPAASGAPVPPPPGPGLSISFEGGNGVGKTTQIRILADLLAAADVGHVLTREPGDMEFGAEIRRPLLHGGYVAPYAGALLCTANRARHIATCVRPALEHGAVVLTDRYLDSSVAYQGAVRSLDPRGVRNLSLWATEDLLPDLTVLLDGNPGLAERRTTGCGAKDRLEREGDAFHAALREQFLTLAEGEPGHFVVVDVDRPVNQVADDITEAVVATVRRHGVRPAHDGAHQGVLLEPEAFMEAAARRSAAGPDAEVRS